MNRITFVLAICFLLSTTSSLFSQTMKDETLPLALYPSYTAAAKDARGDILPSFEQIGFIGRVAFEKIKPTAKDIPADGSNFLDQVFLPVPPIVLKDLTVKGRLSFTDAYKRRLEDAFHTKITSLPKTSPSKTDGALKIEPVPSYYLQVGDAFGGVERAMKKATTTTRKMREFFYAMHAQSLHDLGLQRRAEKLPPADDFLLNWENIPEMGLDVRAITPIGPADPTDPSSGTRYWAVLGIKPLAIEIGHRPYTLLVPVSALVVIPGTEPMTLEEFKDICDKYKTEKAITAALGGRRK